MATDRSIATIELLARNAPGLPLSEIADTLNIPRSATHRQLAELRASGYVRQDHEGGRYQLTPKLAALGMSYLASAGTPSIVQPILDQLSARAEDFVMLCIAESGKLMRVARAQGARGGLVYNPVDPPEVYLAATTNGLAWLSCFDDDEALEHVARQGLQKEGYGPRAPKTLQEVLLEIRRTRERGYALALEIYQPGVAAIAAPIRKANGRGAFGTVSVAGPSVRMTKDRMMAIAPDLLTTTEQLAAVASVTPLFSSE